MTVPALMLDFNTDALHICVLRIEKINGSKVKLPCADFPLEENVQLSECAAFGFWQSEVRPGSAKGRTSKPDEA